ncbi:3-dehydro-L-gulonate 2-dehydrogenase [Terrimonas pollutisoli]|uniref:3-dehydro-L-gulonate 2-dehydrogenase n=1 Tax=Terrimonas pollutisoli TaxID=3034147 RepID=UPI0023EBCFF9|nr:3-dehydro-L-gulonate 2-dehydrogenase [Terrimonas sp. H1YJ31]
MSDSSNIIMVQAEAMQACFEKILLKNKFEPGRAREIAAVFTSNSIDGVYTHGVNRFARFIEYVQKGFVKKDAGPQCRHKFGSIEQWDGNLAPGITNAIFATQQSMKLADENGIGCVSLANTNHWMRGGTYGWQAAKAGYVFIGWTNTIANMPAWGAMDARLGNNPLVIAIPYEGEAIVLDMAMSQYSFGAMELSAMKNEKLTVYGGFDKNGNITNDPAAILESRRPVPVGYWKGAGLSLLLDILATILSGGSATHAVSQREVEYGLSQVFVTINISVLPDHSAIPGLIKNILDDYKQSLPQDSRTFISYPGERVLQTREKNKVRGIPVVRRVWDEIGKLQ